MYTVRIQDIDDRIDAEFYNPLALATETKIKALGKSTKLGALISEGYRVVYHGTDSTNGLPPEKLLPFLSPTKIDDQGAIDFASIDQLPLYYRTDYPKGLAQAGELLIEVKGNVSKVGVVPESFPENLMISGSLYKASFSDGTDSRYVLAFLKSSHGQILKNRLTSNTIINYIAKDALYSIPLFSADVQVQRYIGDKVRQAERLRAWAKKLRQIVDSRLDELGYSSMATPLAVNRVGVEQLENRLDPRPYRSHYIELAKRLSYGRSSRLSELASLSSGCPVSSDDFVEKGPVPLIRIRNIGIDDFIALDTSVDEAFYAREVKYRAVEEMIVLGMDGIFRAQFFIAEDLPILVNQRVAMLTATGIRPELMCHWLNRNEGQMQLEQWAVKTTVEHTSLSDIGRVRIPRLDTSEEDILADQLMSARLAYRYSHYLTQSAKLLVESLIDGQLTEADLIAAQQALNRGEDHLDRALLTHLNTDGFNGQRPALFPDLDQLYVLLAQEQEQEQEQEQA